jgi:hypothetical protein
MDEPLVLYRLARFRYSTRGMLVIFDGRRGGIESHRVEGRGGTGRGTRRSMRARGEGYKEGGGRGVTRKVRDGVHEEEGGVERDRAEALIRIYRERSAKERGMAWGMLWDGRSADMGP